MKVLTAKPVSSILPHNINNYTLNKKLEGILLPITHWQHSSFNKKIIIDVKNIKKDVGIYVGNILHEDGYIQPLIEIDKNNYIILESKDTFKLVGTKNQFIRGYGYGRSAVINNTYKQYIFERDGQCCLKCKSKEDLSVDHILPRSKGGTNSIFNLQTLCRKCNSDKDSQMIDYRIAHTEITNNFPEKIFINSDTNYIINKDGSISYILNNDFVKSKVEMSEIDWFDYLNKINLANAVI